MKDKLLLFVNPDFDRRFQGGISRLYEIFFKKYNIGFEIIDLEFLKKFVPDEDYSQKLVIAGGDGTIHKVINAIPDEAFKKYVFGIIPSGTANEFAKSQLIPMSLYKSADIIASPKKVYNQHIGIINNEYKFATGLLYGIACQVLQVTPKFAKHFFGHHAFHIGIIRYFLQFYNTEKMSPKKFTINLRNFRTNYLLINNASLISKKIDHTEITQENKNLFSIVYLHSRLKPIDVFRLILKEQTHYHILHDPGLHYEQLSKIYLEFNDELGFLLDGEHYRLKSPLNIEYFKYPISVISG